MTTSTSDVGELIADLIVDIDDKVSRGKLERMSEVISGIRFIRSANSDMDFSNLTLVLDTGEVFTIRVVRSG